MNNISNKRKLEGLIKEKEHFPKKITKKDRLQHTVRAQEELSLATNDRNIIFKDFYKKKIDYYNELLKLKERSTAAKERSAAAQESIAESLKLIYSNKHNNII